MTVLIVGLDVITGSRLQLGSPFGLSVLEGGRFYGIGGAGIGLYAVCAVIAIAWVGNALLRPARSPALGSPALGSPWALGSPALDRAASDRDPGGLNAGPAGHGRPSAGRPMADRPPTAGAGRFSPRPRPRSSR